MRSWKSTRRPPPDDFRRHLFGPRPAAEAALAEVAGEPVGFALWFTTFSTFRGQPGLYLEDLFVRPAYRGRGIGKGLLAAWPGWRSSAGCGRLEWSVLDWNVPAIGFYRALGADRWTTGRSIGSTTSRSRNWPATGPRTLSDDLTERIPTR